MTHRVSRMLTKSLIAAAAFSLSLAAFAQALRTATDIPDSRVDVYAGYGYLRPFGSDIGNHDFQPVHNLNATASVTGYFNRYIGAQLEGAYFSGPSTRGLTGQCVNGACSDRDPRYYEAQAGPVFRLPLNRFVPFAHLLGGGSKIAGPVLNPLTWGWGVTGGVGLDYILPYFNNRFAIRPIQADFQYSHVDYGPVSRDGTIGGLGEIYAYKLSGGVVVRFGEPSSARPVELGCTTQPGSVFAGEPVVANASMVNMPKNKRSYFTWSSSGGRLTPNESSATIDTTGLAPGDYTVSSRMSYGKKATEQAICVAPFSVRAYDPPTISCSTNPSTVISGAVVDISTSGISPQNRPLTYSYSASAGQIISAGPTAKLSTAGLTATTITVRCNLVDDLGKTASATTVVNVSAATVPETLQASPLCSTSFERDRKRPLRVDNEAKGCLDDIALMMNQNSNARLVVIGYASKDERTQAAAERTLNIRQYLTQEKGVDASRIDLRVGSTSVRSARTLLVPAGAIISDVDTQSFNEAAIVRQRQAYPTSRSSAVARGRTMRHHAKRRGTAGRAVNP